ncbi:Pectinesterase [Heracleum sosnowskyi]|uniref:Pectinesterase n=1 Tax=Heracleum sosnowskyi TaxID=360622 RepID=A0AAD8GU14_9APIA|nr:Pectinesterase [Heracleum sosnowskyi]
MVSKSLFLATLLIIFSLPFLFSPCTAEVLLPSSPVCRTIPNHPFCRTSPIHYHNHRHSIYDNGRLSILNSIAATHKLMSLINKHLQQSSSLKPGVILALQDCHSLVALNTDFLTTSLLAINKTRTLSYIRADDVQTLLSAILTNTQTCLDGLKELASSWFQVNNDISTLVAKDIKLYSLSLDLFIKGWIPERKVQPSEPPKNSSASKGGTLYWEKFANVTVSKDGTRNFTTISDAVAAAPEKSDQASPGYFVIYVLAGIYEEYVSIPKNKHYLMIVGDGINQTVITGSQSVGDGWSTFNSSTLAVDGQGFVGVNITIRNTAGAAKHQAVALRNSADLSTFYSCSFEGYQDTLYVHSLRQFYRDCDIYGTVDFIFGNAAVVLQNCNIYPRLPLAKQFNTITAQGRTDPNQNTGISIEYCKVRPADDLASSDGITHTYLGRPWKEYSRTIYMHTFMESFIHPEGWREWSGDFALHTSYYAEFNNTGPGSGIRGRVSWPGFHIISSSDAANFTVRNFILGDQWIPKTGTPY